MSAFLFIGVGSAVVVFGLSGSLVAAGCVLVAYGVLEFIGELVDSL